MNDEQSLYEHRKKELLAGLVVFAALTLIIGLMLAWFLGQQSASTVGVIKEPAAIAIYGPNQTYMSQFDLSYDKEEVGDDGTVTIRRPFCITSPSQSIILYVAHTTNINDLKITMHEAIDVTNDVTNDNNAANYIVGIDSRGNTYKWKLKENPWEFGNREGIDGYYINKKKDAYKATNDLHTKIFSNGDTVQENAEPLYWKPSKDYLELSDKKDSEGRYIGNYLLEFTWTESEKETDIVYLIAKST